MKSTTCECVGVRCGAHPMGLCAKKPVKAYKPGGTAPKHFVRWYCDNCARGLKSEPFVFGPRHRSPEQIAEQMQSMKIAKIAKKTAGISTGTKSNPMDDVLGGVR